MVASTVVPEREVAAGRPVRAEPSPLKEAAVTAPDTARVALNVAAPSECNVLDPEYSPVKTPAVVLIAPLTLSVSLSVTAPT